jgi:hypothetical protein
MQKHKGQFWSTTKRERETTLSSVSYSEMLWDRLKPAIWIECRGLLSKDVSVAR